MGSPEQRETSALGMGDLIKLTSPQALGPFVIKITGSTALLERFLPLLTLVSLVHRPSYPYYR